MRTCIRCRQLNIFDSRNICLTCMKAWTSMRSEVYEALEIKMGKFGHDNFEPFKKEMKRMDRLWHKDREKYNIELEKIKICDI